MRAAGLTDGEILEVNQVAAYFAYANRTVSGLGVTTHGTSWATPRRTPRATPGPTAEASDEEQAAVVAEYQR
jgi:uncharacterized protein YciW